jgi:hypothetical protein
MKGSAPGAHSIDVGGIGHPWFRCEEDQLFLHEIYYYYFPYLDFTFFFHHFNDVKRGRKCMLVFCA